MYTGSMRALCVFLLSAGCATHSGDAPSDSGCSGPMSCPLEEDLGAVQDLGPTPASADDQARAPACGAAGAPCSADGDCCLRSCARATQTCNGSNTAGLGDTCWNISLNEH